jgi:UDPglucose 6-dehydrogenase
MRASFKQALINPRERWKWVNGLVSARVCVVGLWHLGCVYASCLAKLGHRVVGTDTDLDVIKSLKAGKAPIFEPGLDELIADGIAAKRLSFDDIDHATDMVDYVIIAFDTPVDAHDRVDPTIIFRVAKRLKLPRKATVVVSSQVPVGTCDQLSTIFASREVPLDLAYVPENLRLGQAIERFMKPDMIIIGATNPTTVNKVRELFEPIRTKFIVMDLKSAEMAKHALNAYLATSISFANEMGNICDLIGADALKVADALKSDRRIGERALLRPGLGFAGGTLARDLIVLQDAARKNQYEPLLVNAVLAVNRNQTTSVVSKAVELVGGLKGKAVCILGLTYKPGTDTLRRSAALEIVELLQKEGASVKAFDPRIAASSRASEHMLICESAYAASDKAEIVVLLNNSPEFANLDFDRIKRLMKKPIVLDTQNLLDPIQMKSHGFSYAGIGRGTGSMS